MIDLALSLLRLLGVRGLLAIGAVVAVVAAYFVVLDRGGDIREAEIAEDNRRAEDAAMDARLTVRECHAAGRRWNQTQDRCEDNP